MISLKNGATGAASAAAGVVGRSGVDLASIEDLVRASEKAAEDAGPAEDAAELVPGRASADWDEAPAQTDISVFSAFAPALGETLAAARAEGNLLFGYAEHSMGTQYLGSSTGLRLRHAQPTGSVQLNAKSGDRSRSAWTGVPTADFTDVDVVAAGQDLARRLEWAKRRIDLPAGRYETILPPTLGRRPDDLRLLVGRAARRRGRPLGVQQERRRHPGSARACPAPRRSRRRCAATRPRPGLECAPYVDGVLLRRVRARCSTTASRSRRRSGSRTACWPRWPTTRQTAAAAQAPLTPYIDNLILEAAPGGAGPSLAELTASTGDGLLLTSLWYIREVDPQTLLLTGLTRDGVYKVEGGEVVGEVNNFRFNESPVSLLARIAEAGRTERTFSREWGDYFNRTAMPALRIPDFNMSSVSPAS